MDDGLCSNRDTYMFAIQRNQNIFAQILELLLFHLVLNLYLLLSHSHMVFDIKSNIMQAFQKNVLLLSEMWKEGTFQWICNYIFYMFRTMIPIILLLSFSILILLRLKRTLFEQDLRERQLFH